MQTIIGITGGTGCGKTTALTALEELGVYIIDCDALYHRLLQTDRELLSAIDEAFPGVVTDGVLQRKKLGAIVFADAEALRRLNAITNRFVTAAVKAELTAHPDQPCAIDAIGLLESGLGELCSHTVAVTAPEEDRVARLMAREGIPEDYARLRIRAQNKNEVFAAACGMTIENHFGSAADFQSHCRSIFSKILKEESNYE